MNDYPTTLELRKIKKADVIKLQFKGMCELIKQTFNLNYGTIREGQGRLYIATGGWSGNEQIMQTLQQTLFWAFYWQKSERGGAYTFKNWRTHATSNAANATTKKV